MRLAKKEGNDMRELLFRGRRVDNADWVYGNYLAVNYAAPVIITDADMEDNSCLDIDDYYHVEASTVGQYTGLKDKKGKRIFEGDIIHHEKAYGEILFGEYESKAGGSEIGFYIKWHDQIYDGYYRNDIKYWIDEGAFVVGNIHDNQTKINLSQIKGGENA